MTRRLEPHSHSSCYFRDGTLGQHLDALINPIDAPGDEGDRFKERLSLSTKKQNQGERKDAIVLSPTSDKHIIGEASSLSDLPLASRPFQFSATESATIKKVGELKDGSLIITGVFKGTTGWLTDKGWKYMTADYGDETFIAILSKYGQIKWITQNKFDIADLVIDNNGDILITGTFTGTGSFGSHTLEPSYTYAVNTDIFVAKLKDDGTYDWAQKVRGNDNDKASQISLLENGSVAITGEYYGQAGFGEFWLVSNGVQNSAEAFVAKLDSDENFLWAKDAGSNYSDSGRSVIATSEGSIIAGGIFSREASFDDIRLTSYGYYQNQAYLAKLGPEGEFEWAIKGGDGSGNYNQGILLEPLKNGLFVTAFAGSEGIVIKAVDAASNTRWQMQSESAGTSQIQNVFATDILSLRDSSSIVTGWFTGSIQFGSHILKSSGREDIFLLKVDSQGGIEWINSIGGEAVDKPESLTALSDGSLVLAGSFGGKLQAQDQVLSASGSDSGFITRLTANGEWIKNGTSPIYTISLSSDSISEGQLLTTEIITSNTENGKTVYWALSGRGVNSSDLSIGAMSGESTVRDGRFEISHELKNDQVTEGSENIEIRLYSDREYNRQIGPVVTILVNDTSVDPPAYTISPSAREISEGEELLITVSTENVAKGTYLYWTISGPGIDASDFNSGPLGNLWGTGA